MYIYDQGRTSVASLGIGRLGAFAKSSKKRYRNRLRRCGIWLKCGS